MTQNSIPVKNSITNPFKWRAITIEIFVAIIIIVLLYTGISKLIDRLSFHVNLEMNPLFHNYALFVSYAAPILEIVLAVSLIFTKTRKAGLLASAFLMSFFTGYVIYLMVSLPNLPCSCGGIVGWLNWTQHLILNIFLTIISFAGFLLLRKQQRPV